ncbi:MAG: hypothetical protein U0271_43350 [Polyangiaceae bacterium]
MKASCFAGGCGLTPREGQARRRRYLLGAFFAPSSSVGQGAPACDLVARRRERVRGAPELSFAHDQVNAISDGALEPVTLAL